MPFRRICAILLAFGALTTGAVAEYCPPSSAQSDGMRDIMLIYGEPGKWKKDDFLPYVAYLDPTGKPRDWFYDAYLFMMYGGSPSGTTYIDGPSSKSDWEYFIAEEFAPDREFAALDTTNGKVAAPEVGGAGSTAGPVSGGDLGTGGGAIALASASPAPSPARAAATAGSSIGAALTVSPPPSSGPLQVPSANPQDLAGAGTPAGGGQGAAPPVPTPGAPSAPGGLDLRILALVVSGAGLIAGLLILAVPSILRRRAS